MSSKTERKLPPIRRRILSPSERDRMEQQIDQNDREARGKLDQDADVGPAARRAYEEQGDRKFLDQRSARLKRALAAGTAGPISGAERVNMEKRAKELGGYLSSRMVPKEGVRLRPGSVEFNRAKNMMVKQELGSAEFQTAASEWKNIQRSLHPDDSDAANLETIRPERA